MKPHKEQSELSRPLKVDKIPMGGIEERIVARPEERAALIERLDLLDLSRLEAVLNVDHEPDQILAVTGSLYAEIVQRCVVSLDPVPAQIREPIQVLFAPANLIKPGREGNFGELGEADPPEPIENGAIDLGELVVQHLAMALDPYPRKEGVSWQGYESNPPKDHENRTVINPFAKLTSLKKDPKSES